MEQLSDYFPSLNSLNTQTNQVCYALMHPDEITTGFTDLTGYFPKKSSRGNECIIVGYHCNAKCILGILLKNRKGVTIADTWKNLHSDFKKVGIAPSICVLDNETSIDLINRFKEENIMY